MPIYINRRSATFSLANKRERLIGGALVEDLNRHISAVAQRAIVQGSLPEGANVHLAIAEQNAEREDVVHLSFSDQMGSHTATINEGAGPDTLYKHAKSTQEVSKRASKMPNAQKGSGDLKGKWAKRISQSKYLHQVSKAASGLFQIGHTVEGSKLSQKMNFATGALNLTGAFGLAAATVTTLSAVEDLQSLRLEEASLARKAEVIASITENTLNAAGYGAIAVSGGMRLAQLASKVAFLTKLGDLFLGISSFATVIKGAITFHTKRIFFNSTNEAILRAESRADVDVIAGKADAIWMAIHGKVNPDMEIIQEKITAFSGLTENEQICDLVKSFEKGLGWHFWNSKSKKEKIQKYRHALTEQLDGLNPQGRQNVLVAAKRKLLISSAESAKAKDVEVIGSKKFSELMLKEGKEVNIQLRHHQWGVIHLYGKMEGEYKSKRLSEVVGIVANLGSGIISVVGFVVPGGIIVTAIRGSFSALQIGSSIHMQGRTILAAMGFNVGDSFDDEITRICRGFAKRHITYLGLASAA